MHLLQLYHSNAYMYTNVLKNIRFVIKYLYKYQYFFYPKMQFGMYTIPEDHIIIKTQYSFVFVNLRPFLPHHILVSSLCVKQYLSDLTTDEYSDLFDTVRRTVTCLKKYGTAFTVNVQDGPAAGQTVPHVHVHIIPRNRNDIEDNDLVYAKGALDIVRTDRGFDEMAAETKTLRHDFDNFFAL